MIKDENNCEDRTGKVFLRLKEGEYVLVIFCLLLLLLLLNSFITERDKKCIFSYIPYLSRKS